ncbi:AMP-binding protein [Pseudomonas sp. OIL-1]|uniref:AMP-binding protein n=1 Tax=Pseudomonas sp. OIL-1 TaxID=2706126 RepID=UPI0013A74653|nr:AMP-binding protein [Pseudomonas sp. OIL-1]QIB52016.1 AMP-binding protein [Pseudomonas sp. OIL-1]
MPDQVKLAVSSALESFYERERAHPDKVYLVQPHADASVDEFTWAQVGDQARRIASYLRSLELEPGSHIALFSKNCAHWIIADLAIWMAGHVSVPIYPTLGRDSVRPMLEHAECRAAFIGKLDSWQRVRPTVYPDIPWIGLPLAPEDADLLPWQSLLESNEPLSEDVLPDPAAVATLVYTAGTSGPPKGVMLSFSAMYHAASNWLRLFVINDNDRLLSYLPLSNVAERQFVQIASLLGGETVYFVHGSDTFVRDMRRARPTVFFGVPRLWSKLQRSVYRRVPAIVLNPLLKIPLLRRIPARMVLATLGLNHIRYAVSGGAPPADDMLRWFQRLGMNLVEIYGMTENCGYSHLGRPQRFKSGWVGLPNPGVECRLAEDGELLLRSRATMLGYFKDPDATARMLDENGFLHTGDLGEVDKEGFVRVIGRARDLFTTRAGKVIPPGPIERLLDASSLIEQSCVLGEKLPQPIALVQLQETESAATPSRDQVVEERLTRILSETNKRLPQHQQLACLVVIGDKWSVNNGFITPTLKLKRHVVEATYQDQLEIWSVSGKRVLWQETPTPG